MLDNDFSVEGQAFLKAMVRRAETAGFVIRESIVQRVSKMQWKKTR